MSFSLQKRGRGAAAFLMAVALILIFSLGACSPTREQIESDFLSKRVPSPLTGAGRTSGEIIVIYEKEEDSQDRWWVEQIPAQGKKLFRLGTFPANPWLQKEPNWNFLRRAFGLSSVELSELKDLYRKRDAYRVWVWGDGRVTDSEGKVIMTDFRMKKLTFAVKGIPKVKGPYEPAWGKSHKEEAFLFPLSSGRGLILFRKCGNWGGDVFFSKKAICPTCKSYRVYTRVSQIRSPRELREATTWDFSRRAGEIANEPPGPWFNLSLMGGGRGIRLNFGRGYEKYAPVLSWEDIPPVIQRALVSQESLIIENRHLAKNSSRSKCFIMSGWKDRYGTWHINYRAMLGIQPRNVPR